LERLSIEEYKKSLANFDQKWPNHWYREDDFGDFFSWKLQVESGKGHILDANHAEEAYEKLCRILPSWQTYRPKSSEICLGFLRNSLRRISGAYDQIRKYSLLEFSVIPDQPLELIWHELGRAKEDEATKDDYGSYSIVAISKPLMLMWGQTPALDSEVRRNLLKDLAIYPKYRFSYGTWTYEDWKTIMDKFQENLQEKAAVVDYFKRETLRIFGSNLIIPFGRFLDILYYF